MTIGPLLWSLSSHPIPIPPQSITSEHIPSHHVPHIHTICYVSHVSLIPRGARPFFFFLPSLISSCRLRCLLVVVFARHCWSPVAAAVPCPGNFSSWPSTSLLADLHHPLRHHPVHSSRQHLVAYLVWSSFDICIFFVNFRHTCICFDGSLFSVLSIAPCTPSLNNQGPTAT